nr:hypothetical protein GCM10020093_017940 [Planobispora longispora]
MSHRGETLTLPLDGGEGKELALAVSPVQERLPVYLAAMSPGMIALAGSWPTAGWPSTSRPSTSPRCGPI